MPGRRLRRATVARAVASIVVLVASCTLLAVGVVHSMQITRSLASPADQAAWESAAAQTRCLTDAVERAVPRHSSVVLRGTGYPLQRLAEAAATWATVTEVPSAASWALSIGTGPACQGLQITSVRT